METHEYELLQNAQGELVMVMNAGNYEPEQPRLVYDGGEKMIYYPCKECAFTLTVQPEARAALNKVGELIVAEVGENEDIQQYKVVVKHVDALDAYLK